MAIPVHLAMSAAEFAVCKNLPPSLGWLSCHFSPSGTGLSNMPTALPPGSVLLVDDSNPFCQHQPERIGKELAELTEKLQIQWILLDFQRSMDAGTANLTEYLFTYLPCTVVAPPVYSGKNKPVLLPPCPLNIPLKDYIAPYREREIWLELSLDGLQMHVTRSGCITEAVSHTDAVSFPHGDKLLHCHYAIVKKANTVTFHLQRTREDLQRLLDEAERLGIAHAIGLWQELA